MTQLPFVLSEVEGRFPTRMAACFDVAQHERPGERA